MQLITPMMDYPKLTKQLCHMPGHDILLKATATGDDYNLFRMLKFQEETFIKFHYGLHYFCDPFSESKKIYIYYIPQDILPYTKYQDKKITERIPIPKELIQKFTNCKRYIEVDFNYMFDMYQFNIFGTKTFFQTRKAFHFGKPIVIIRKSKGDKISFNNTYDEILKCPYINEYDRNQKIKEYYIKCGKCLE